MKIIFFFLLISTSAYSYTDIVNLNGLGTEMITMGTGLARTGSTGAVYSNPSLLSDLSKVKKFTSTNVIVSQKENDSSTRTDFKPEVIPLFAGNSKGDGHSGWAYGLYSVKFRYQSSFSAGSDKSKYEGEFSQLGLLAGYGKKIDDQWSWGIQIEANRGTSEVSGKSSGSQSGFSYSGTFEQESSIWSANMGLGTNIKGDNWSLGASAKMNILKFGHRESSKSEIKTSTGQTYKEEFETTKAKIIPRIGIGAFRRFSFTDCYSDLLFTPRYTDPDTDKQVNPSFTIRNSFEQMPSGSSYVFYEGIGFTPGTSNANDSKNESFSGSLGVSEKGEHSLGYGGFTYSRDLFSSGNTQYLLTFGTTFDY